MAVWEYKGAGVKPARHTEPLKFEYVCREGMCGAMVNGVAHGPQPGTTLCQLHMRHFKNGDEIYIEPWRAAGGAG